MKIKFTMMWVFALNSIVCLWQNLTPGEHLYLFGRMKGLQGKDLSLAVKYFLQIM